MVFAAGVGPLTPEVSGRLLRVDNKRAKGHFMDEMITLNAFSFIYSALRTNNGLSGFCQTFISNRDS